MGSGSSRAAKSRSGRCRGLARGSGSSSAPAGQGQGQAGTARAAAAGGGTWYCSSSCSRQSPVRPPSPPLGEADSDSELLDRMLEECDDGRLELPGRRLDAGDFCSRPAGGGAGKKEDGIPRQERVFLARSIQESNDFANQVPLRKPEIQAKVSYDYSEEELMAIIEQEYCR